MTEIEDPVTTLVRLFKTNIRVVNDDNSIANVYASREWYDRELLKNYDGQVTVGLRQASSIKPVSLSHALTQRVLNFKVDCWVVDKAGKQTGNRTRSKLREEILRLVRQKRFSPNETLCDFCGLGLAGPHDAYQAASTAELTPSSSSWVEFTAVQYQNLWYSDDSRVSKSTSVNLEYAMTLFKIKLETSKYDPHENSVNKIVLSLEGYGTAPSGNGVTIKVWNHVSSAWEQVQTGSGGSDETITITLTTNLADFIEMDSSGVGYIHLLARTTNPSDGVIPAVLHCDYVKYTLTVEGLTHIKFGTFHDADDVSVKPFLLHTEFLVIGWMFENVPAT
ncbi:MAG TPA: hypothetical protein VJ249_01170 [Candidatus Bathyarchaeia archaeon]|nr:hypothetical protein [Candidatus Bathyarchaeia archaeon]